MSAENFVAASRQKLRFVSPKGLLATEDLWELPLTSQTGRANLDDIAKGLFSELKESEQVSFVDDAKKSATSVELALKLDIVKYIISVKKAERDEAKKAEAAKAQRQKILEIISNKEDKALEEKSIDELRAMLNDQP